jgi:hypothetical protein
VPIVIPLWAKADDGSITVSKTTAANKEKLLITHLPGCLVVLFFRCISERINNSSLYVVLVFTYLDVPGTKALQNLDDETLVDLFRCPSLDFFEQLVYIID